MLNIDGSYLEGGGAIARVALALSTLTYKPFEITKIRIGRKKPGLKAQHLWCIKALEQLCSAKSENAELGSLELKYYPEKIKAKTINIDIGTAGSISLLLQAVLLPSMFADKEIRLKITGGTAGKWATPVEYLENVFAPQIKRFCEKFEIKMLRRGYYPKGGGKVEIKIRPKYKLCDFDNFDAFLSHLKQNIQPYSLTEQGSLIQIKGISHASLNLQKAEVAERQARAAKFVLNKYSCPISMRTEYSDTLSAGSGITLYAIFSRDKEEIDINNPIRLGADALGEPGKRAETVGKEAADRLVKEIESKAVVDSHLADQILPYMALTSNSKIKTSELTKHCRTNIYVIEQFLGKCLNVDEEERIIKTG